MIARPLRPVVAVALALTQLPSPADGQFRRGRADGEAPGPWAPIVVGVHGGYENASRGEMLGAHAFVPILRNGIVQLLPGAETTFLNNGAKDHQLSAELVYMTGAREGGFYIGGGIGRRSSFIDSTPESPGRNRFTTLQALAGFQSAAGGPVVLSLQIRRIFVLDVESDFRPNAITVGLGFPLWGRGDPS